MTRRLTRWTAVLLIALAPVGPAAADDEPAIWAYEGNRSVVLLLGSVHLLRKDDYPLPVAIDAAYRAADTLVMEIDIGNLDPLSSQMLITQLGTLGTGRTLQDVMGAGDYRKAARRATELGIDLTLFDAVEPWFAALTIMNLQLLRLGFDPQIGLEQHLAGKARRDGKKILGLETVEYQLRLFDELPGATQSHLLLQTLDEASSLASQMDALISAWRRGDSARLAQELGRSFQGYPDVYRKLVSDRNRAWVRRIVDLGDTDGSHLVVVGALHLVGENSVIAMLEGTGGLVRRWHAGR
jgi:uncharacterized protein YbaP (TraB family)